MTLAENIPVLAPLAGGALIGLSVAMLLLLGGCVVGISGIFGHTLKADFGPGAWRLLFIVGLLLSIPLYALVQGHNPAYSLEMNTPVLMLAGLLVGVGTRLGRGCTSGHGVCGISNLSPRSLMATGIFMTTAAVVVYLVRHGGF